MTKHRLAPPVPDSSPTSVPLGDEQTLDLILLAREICRLYRAEFPDEEKRYGDAGHAWCVHDNQYLLYWAVEAVNGYIELTDEVGWLAGVLEARGFPLSRLARNLDIAAAVVQSRVGRTLGKQLADALTSAAAYVRGTETFLA